MSFEKFRILLWKNWTIQKRHWKSGLFDVICSVVLVILFTLIKKEYSKDYEESELSYFIDQVRPSVNCSINDQIFNKIVFSPTSPWLEEFLKAVYNERENVEFEVFESSFALDQFLNDGNARSRSESLFGIEFDDSMKVKLQIL